ncbi:helix-turn-helix transcriptional regulator [Streptomyces sp. KS 21]|uniref:telomere-associated protein Tap n=1 Tax=Streptomyces sp. KS 21 TaxID=2485150 RepID=UPI001062BC0B|nr:helix-turn-helix transcriptional regulator [Streptomyces sp. KS 21]TDU67107.1 telomere-binding protein Tap [Streptomyces sp. KS 21]
MSTENELFSAVDALLEQVAQDDLPAPAERRRLREAAGLSQAQIAKVLDARREAVGNWETGRTEPRPPKRAAYARLLEGLAARYPLPAVGLPAAAPASAAPEAFTGPAPEPVPAPAASVSPSRPAASRTARPGPSSRRPAAKKATKKPIVPTAAATDPRYENGPLAVLDVDGNQVVAYCVGGLVLDVPAKSLPSLVEWTLTQSKLGAPRLHPLGKDSDPLIVLTAAAAVRYGLPEKLSDEERRAGRLPEGHKVLKQLAKADWQLTQRGFGPWARIYRPAEGGQRRCVQLCVVSWDALDVRDWGDKDKGLLPAMLPPAELARVLGTFAARVLTPRGTTAVTGLELMTALRPPSRRARDEETGEWRTDADGQFVRERIPGSLPERILDAVPCEVPDGHPLLADLPRYHQRGPAEMLMEETYDWGRPLTDEECLKSHVVGIDVNMAFAAASNGTVVGLGAPVHVKNPAFDPKVPGSWLVDLSHIELDPRLPSPFTRTGERPEGPAWYATPSVAYAVKLGFPVTPIEAYLRPDSGRYLDPWYTRLKDAYLATMADLGVTPDMEGQAFLDAMAASKTADPEMLMVLRAIKATAKGGIGKLRERPRDTPLGQPWPALSRPTWRPDIRAAVLSTSRIIMHRKIMKMATHGLYPVAINSDCIVYPSDGPSPLDFLPATPGPGEFRLGVTPGLVKHEGSQTTLWAEAQYEQDGPHTNIARIIKSGGHAATDDGE